MTRHWRLAIDFGTSNTAAAHRVEGEEAAALPLTHGSDLMPSAVFVGSEGIEVGAAAVNRAPSAPAAYLPSPKRHLETETLAVDGRPVPVTTVVAAVIDHVLATAARFHDGTAPDQVVLTHPEAWSPQTVDRLVRAALEAGIPRDRLALVSEPRAAAHFYSRGAPVEPGRQVAVFDYGGGTLDVAVLRAGPEGFRVVAARGDNALGGRNIDALLRLWVDEQLEEEHPEVADRLAEGASADTLRSLERSIRSAKELLSDTTTATVTVSGPEGETPLALTRGELERVIDDDVTRALELTAAALRDAGGEATTVYATGGTSRIPHVLARLGEVARVATLDDPKTVVARGALHAPATTPEGRVARPPAADPRTGGQAGPGGPGGGAGGSGGKGASGSGSYGSVPDGRSRPRRRGPLVLGAVLGVVLLVAGLVWGGVALTSDDDPAASKPAVPGLDDAARAVLPDAYLTALKSCDGNVRTTLWSTADTGETSCAWRDPDGIQARYGVLWSTESVAPAFAETIRSAAAPGAVHDAYRAEVVQQADEGAHRPLVVIATPSDPKTQPSLAITYPGSDVTICAPNVDTVEQARALATDLGFVGG